MSDNESTDSSFGGLGKAWALSALLMAAVALGLVFVLWPSGDANDDATDPSPTSTAPSGAQETIVPSDSAAPSSAKGWDDKGCNGTDGSDEIPTKAPGGVKWEPIGAAAVPTSSEFGPAESSRPPVRKCFQHSPTGAVFAAVNIPASMGTSASAAVAVLSTQMTEGAVHDQWIAEAKAGGGSARAASVAGFRVRACAPDRCLIDLVMDEAGTRAQVSWTMLWVDGDWKLDGSSEPAAGLVETPGVPAGFAPWMPGM